MGVLLGDRGGGESWDSSLGMSNRNGVFQQFFNVFLARRLAQHLQAFPVHYYFII